MSYSDILSKEDLDKLLGCFPHEKVDNRRELTPDEIVELFSSDEDKDNFPEDNPQIYLEIIQNIKELKKNSSEYNRGWNDAIDEVLKLLHKKV